MTVLAGTITEVIMSVVPAATALPQAAAWHPAEHTAVSIPATDADTTTAVHLRRGISGTAMQPQTVHTVHRADIVRQPLDRRLHPLPTGVIAPRRSVPRRLPSVPRHRPSTRTATTATTGVTIPTVTTTLTTGTRTTAARTTAAAVRAAVTEAEAVEAAGVAPVADTEDN